MNYAIKRQLDPIFRPRSVAVVGASNNPERWGNGTMRSVLDWSQFRGEVYPVNPKEDQVCGIKAYKSVLDVPAEIDLAVIVVNAAQAVDVFRQCVCKKVGGAVIITAGFAEIGDQGRQMQEELKRLSMESGIRFVGPNCNGIWSSAVRLNLCFWGIVQPGPTAFISQSGTMGDYLFDVAQAKGYGFARFVSSGNQASLDVCDYLEYLADDEETKAITLYLEGVSDGKRFLEAARKATANKPVLVYKVGRTAVGARAAASHTASLTGSADIFDAACRQAGVIICENMLEMFDYAEALGNQPLPRGNRVAIASGGGGFCVVTSEACAKMGLEVPVLHSETQQELRKHVREFSPPLLNPVDLIARKSHLDYAAAIEVLAKQDYIDGLIIMPPYGGIHRTTPVDVMKSLVDGCAMIAEIPAKHKKPVLAFAMREYKSTATFEILKRGNIPFFESPETCARAMNALVLYGKHRRARG
ncbi:MAG: acetyl-CoA synthetase [Candidatus Abyssobacteria bacterium SURF_5]|uniref:Acetyl-CoA synthetase n=1 Tax=Abyssobacteria bacterium (strain SURF_5) TaxID=2093360 RepID=A0A3A4NSQ0_ABYX5|nr:MAG: acetyl-CoA synthetase [Candidatus Abyssubacteria bacterium SURF_5]